MKTKEMQRIFFSRPSGREAWLEERKKGIGSSEVATIFGVNPFDTPYRLWLRKTGRGGETPETQAMLMGHLLEPVVAELWSRETGIEIIKRSAPDWLIIDRERPFLRVSPDRTYYRPGMKRNEAGKGILECKTTQMEIDAFDVHSFPKSWFVQLQYQLGVARLEEGELAWLTRGRDFGHMHVRFSPSLYEELVEKVERFWRDYIVADKAPEDITPADVLLMFPHHTEGEFREMTDEQYATYTENKFVRKQIAALLERREELDSRLKAAFREAEGLTYGGDLLATWKSPKASIRIDGDAILADHPEIDRAKYEKEVQGARRLLLK